MHDPAQPRVGFLVVGAQRGGTTALARYLAGHPDVCVAPCKEAHFFDRPEEPPGGWDSEQARRRYLRFFPDYAGQAAVGEATPTYIYFPFVPSRIRTYNPAMRLVFLLREPGERAVSHYWHVRQFGGEWLPIWPAFLLERWRLARARGDCGERSSWRNHSYADRGRYATQIRRFLDEFPREQLLFLRSEELLADHAGVLRRVYRFLGVAEPQSLPAPALHNQAPGTGRRRTRAAQWVSRSCRASTRELEQLLGWDLAHWRRG